MFKASTLPDHQNPPSGSAHCSNCGAPMGVVGDNYVCPANTKGGPDRCPTTPVNTGALMRQVATQVLKRIMTEDTIGRLTRDVQQTASEKSSMQQQRLQDAEASLKDLGRLRQKVLRPVEQKLATYHEVAEDINRINATGMGLAYESHVAQDEIEKLAFISDTEGLREDAQDITTLLDDADLEETMQLLSIFVRDIRVGAESAGVFYSHPLPDEQGHARVTSDLIPLAR